MAIIPTLNQALFNKFYQAGIAMVVAALITIFLTPRQMISDLERRTDLETIIPKQFEDWKIDSSIVPITPDPQREAELNKIYSQTLGRTYFNAKGQRVMLSIAYGGDQSKALQVHKPEACYASQGFEVGKMTKNHVATAVGQIPVMRLVAKQGNRNEPITYWIRVGDTVTRGWFEQNLARFSYGMDGKIADGVLVRVSTISHDEKDSFEIQQTFLAAMLLGIRKEDRAQLIGELGVK